MISQDLRRYARAKTIVNEILDRPAAERERLLNERCGDDLALRREVAWLLDECLRPSVPNAVIPPTDTAGEAVTEAPPPGYHIHHLIGRGGMGTVYLAERDAGGLKQRVALKMLNYEAMLLPFARQHFERERQILAELSHPNISSFIDGGTTDDGRPFLAMEYVDGQRIDRWCAEHRTDVRKRIRLMIQVCNAVDYAHKRLVIHRDIKPGNILINDQGVPKLLDFGIARSLSAEDGTAHFQTHGAQALMTLAYAAPEQIKGQTLTTAVDVYGLGIVLYELLTTTNPFASGINENPHEVIRAICDIEVPAPSVASARRRTRRVPEHPTAPEIHSNWIGFGRGGSDLDHIVLRALRKDPAARYPSVAALAEDLRRYLDHLPITARYGETFYRWRRFAARHTWGLVFSTLLVSMLMAFIVSRQIQLEATERERERAETTVTFIKDFFKAADPGEARGRQITVAEVMRSASHRVEAGMTDNPSLQASLMITIGDIYANLSPCCPRPIVCSAARW